MKNTHKPKLRFDNQQFDINTINWREVFIGLGRYILKCMDARGGGAYLELFHFCEECGIDKKIARVKIDRHEFEDLLKDPEIRAQAKNIQGLVELYATIIVDLLKEHFLGGGSGIEVVIEISAAPLASSLNDYAKNLN